MSMFLELLQSRKVKDITESNYMVTITQISKLDKYREKEVIDQDP